MSKNIKKLIKSKLSEVLDPELGISIVDLGLIYKIKTTPTNQVSIIMTLTTVGCPLFDLIKSEIIKKIKELGFREQNIKIELTFDPPWTVEKMSQRGKAMIGI